MTHPVVLAALAVLLLNDHVLKRAWPGLVTGKLSDVAGPIVAAALAGAALRLLGRRWERAAWVGVAAAFALLKTVPALNALVPLAGVADPWDVLGLVALPFAWRATRRPPPWRPRVVWRAAAIVAAVLAVSATSQEPAPSVDRIRAEDGTLRAYGTGYEISYEWRSADRGATWNMVRSETTGPSPTATPSLPAARSRACSGRICYDIAGGDAVLESRDGGRSWRVSFVTDERGWKLTDVTFAGDDVVLVAAGRAGWLRLANGRWHHVPSEREEREGPGLVEPLGWLAGIGGLAVLITLALCLLVLFVLDRLTRASPRARTEGEDVWSPPPHRTRSSPRRSPRHRR